MLSTPCTIRYPLLTLQGSYEQELHCGVSARAARVVRSAFSEFSDLSFLGPVRSSPSWPILICFPPAKLHTFQVHEDIGDRASINVAIIVAAEKICTVSILLYKIITAHPVQSNPGVLFIGFRPS